MNASKVTIAVSMPIALIPLDPTHADARKVTEAMAEVALILTNANQKSQHHVSRLKHVSIHLVHIAVEVSPGFFYRYLL